MANRFTYFRFRSNGKISDINQLLCGLPCAPKVTEISKNADGVLCEVLTFDYTQVTGVLLQHGDVMMCRNEEVFDGSAMAPVSAPIFQDFAAY